MAKLVRDRYEVIRPLGRGAQGLVALARDHQHDRLVALKIRLAVSDEERRQVLREAGALLQMRPHPSLPVAREDFFEGDRYYLVMDWIDGRTLQELLDDEGDPGLAPDDVVRYLRAAAEALDHLHSHDPAVLHGDVKPSNLILTPSEEIVLVDFGSTTRTPRAPYTAAFAAPEVRAGEAPTPSADIYALAATAYALLTGQPPVPPTVDTGRAPREQEILEALGPALSFDPALRPGSALELADAIASVFHHYESTRTPTGVANPVTRIIGRQEDSRAVLRLLETSMLVTITGPGGVGKTSLAMEVASRSPWHPGGVSVVDLAPLDDGSRLAQRTAEALGLPDQPGVGYEELLQEALARRECLLVLDNCERILDACADLAQLLAGSCPGVHVLATSREPMSTGGESVWTLSPLASPSADEAVDRHLLGRYASVRLFAQRARAASRSFRLDDETSAHVAEICRRLDGLPLALELAASLTRTMHVGDLLAQLDNRFSLLSGQRGTTERHRALGATLDWSYEVLDPAEQAVFRRLSVFAGSFDVPAATAVCAEGEVQAEAVEPILRRLLSGSLVTLEDNQRDRFRLLETMREYGAEKLEEHQETHATKERHVHHFSTVAAEASRGLRGQEQLLWLERLELDHDNLRTGMRWALEHDPRSASRIVGWLMDFWRIRAHAEEARSFAAAVLERVQEPVQRAAAWIVAGDAAEFRGDRDDAVAAYAEAVSLAEETGQHQLEALAHQRLAYHHGIRVELEQAKLSAYRSLELARSFEDPLVEADALFSLAMGHQMYGNFREAIDYYEQALGLYRSIGLISGTATCLNHMAEPLRCCDQYARAQAALDEAAPLVRKLGDRMQAIVSLEMRSLVRLGQGDMEEGRRILEQAVAESRDIGRRAGIGYTLNNLGLTLAELGEPKAALSHLEEAVTLMEEEAGPSGRGLALSNLALVLVQHGDLERASEVLEEGFSLLRGTGSVYEASAIYALATLEERRGNLHEALDAYCAAGRMFEGDNLEAIPAAIGAAYVLAQLGDLSRAAAVLASADAEVERSPVAIPPISAARRSELAAHLSEALGDTIFANLTSEGRTIPLPEAFSFARCDRPGAGG